MIKCKIYNIPEYEINSRTGNYASLEEKLNRRLEEFQNEFGGTAICHIELKQKNINDDATRLVIFYKEK